MGEKVQGLRKSRKMSIPVENSKVLVITVSEMASLLFISLTSSSNHFTLTIEIKMNQYVKSTQ